jgi:GH24 family phage-related lysozyme (muramidase)
MLTARIVNFIGGHEGFVSSWYLDPAGVPTIGYGFTWGNPVFREWWTAKHGRKMRNGDTITQTDAYAVLLAILEHDVLPAVQAKLGRQPINVIEAASSAVYNLGTGALAWKWAGSIARGAVAGGAEKLRKTGTTAGGKRLPGLVRRRNEEADIAEFNRWPTWVTEENVAPNPHVDQVDIQQAQLWLNELGYDCGRADGVPGERTVRAAKRFQQDHGTLLVDGIIGAATLAALQRAVDLKKAATVTATAGGGAVVAGVGENVTGAGDAVQLPADAPVHDLGWIGDAFLLGGLLVAAAVFAWLAWRYRDELVAAFKKL